MIRLAHCAMSVAAAMVGSALGVTLCSLDAQTPPLRLIQSIELPGVQGRIDHLAVDVRSRRLFVAALGNDTIEVLDLAAGTHTKSIAGFHEPQGVAFIPELDRIIVANGRDGSVDIVDAAHYRVVRTVKLAGDADNVRYEPGAKRAYVGYGRGALGMLNPADGSRLGDVALDGHPESFQLERDGPRIFVNVATAGHVAVVDRERRTVTAKWPLVGAQANFPMALDEANHRLLVGCRRPPTVLVYDTSSGRKVTQFPIGVDTDDLFYDAAAKRVYVAAGGGVISAFRQTDPDHYQLLGTIRTASGARTSLFVPQFKRLYLAIPHRGLQRSEIRVFEVQP